MHDDDGVTVGERKDHLDAGGRVAGNIADRVASCVENVAGRFQLPDPCGLYECAGVRVAHLNNVAGHSIGAVEWRQGNVQLLETAAEEDGECVSEGSKETMPLRPGVERVGRGALVEVADWFGDEAEVAVRSGEAGEVFDETSRAGLHDLKVAGAGVVEKEVFADLTRVADGAVEPEGFAKKTTASGDLDPSLCYPIG